MDITINDTEIKNGYHTNNKILNKTRKLIYNHITKLWLKFIYHSHKKM